MATLIGTTWKHKKRGSTYRVIGVTLANMTGLKDMDEALFWSTVGRRSRDEPTAFGISKDLPDLGERALMFAIPIRLQIEVPRTLEIVVIYQADEDGSIWGRPEDEFLDGRFEQITQCN